MNKSIKAFTTFMIILLGIILVIVFLSYYNNASLHRQRIDTSNPSGEPINAMSDFEKQNSSFDIPSNTQTNTEPKQQENTNANTEVDTKVEDKASPQNGTQVAPKNVKSTTIETFEPQVTTKPINSSTQLSGEEKESLSNQIVTITTSGNTAPSSTPAKIIVNQDEPIIYSDINTSNQEKQNVLDEIDVALKGLLEAVGNVKGVDETKLDASLESRGDL